MDINLMALILYGQLWWSPLSAEIKEPANSSSFYLYPTRKYGYLIKNERGEATPYPSSTVKPYTEDQNPHRLAAVIIGVILLSMIIIMVAIFLWKRWRHSRDSPVLHWAGRSPFADGDTPDAVANKESTHSMKRTSVLSLLPWKFNKDTQLLDSDEGQLSESKADLDVLPKGSAEETVGQSSPTARGKCASSTSTETSVCDTPSTPTDGPLQPTIPEPLDLPPPPYRLCGANGDLCATSNESHLLEQNANAQCSVVPNLVHQNLGEELLLPPPPEDFI